MIMIVLLLLTTSHNCCLKVILYEYTIPFIYYDILSHYYGPFMFANGCG